MNEHCGSGIKQTITRCHQEPASIALCVTSKHEWDIEG